MRLLRYASVLWAACLAATCLATAPSAAEDTSADAIAFHTTIEASDGVMIRVPVNDRGEENTDAAEIRVTSGASPAAGALPEAWQRAVDASTQPVVDRSSDSSTDADASTWGWYPWGGWGWRYNYYNSYRPYYNYYGSYYSYGNPYSYTVYGGYPYYGYRYYYYGRSW